MAQSSIGLSDAELEALLARHNDRLVDVMAFLGPPPRRAILKKKPLPKRRKRRPAGEEASSSGGGESCQAKRTAPLPTAPQPSLVISGQTSGSAGPSGRTSAPLPPAPQPPPAADGQTCGPSGSTGPSTQPSAQALVPGVGEEPMDTPESRATGPQTSAAQDPPVPPVPAEEVNGDLQEAAGAAEAPVDSSEAGAEKAAEATAPQGDEDIQLVQPQAEQPPEVIHLDSTPPRAASPAASSASTGSFDVAPSPRRVEDLEAPLSPPVLYPPLKGKGRRALVKAQAKLAPQLLSVSSDPSEPPVMDPPWRRVVTDLLANHNAETRAVLDEGRAEAARRRREARRERRKRRAEGSYNMTRLAKLVKLEPEEPGLMATGGQSDIPGCAPPCSQGLDEGSRIAELRLPSLETRTLNDPWAASPNNAATNSSPVPSAQDEAATSPSGQSPPPSSAHSGRPGQPQPPSETSMQPGQPVTGDQPVTGPEVAPQSQPPLPSLVIRASPGGGFRLVAKSPSQDSAASLAPQPVTSIHQVQASLAPCPVGLLVTKPTMLAPAQAFLVQVGPPQSSCQPPEKRPRTPPRPSKPPSLPSPTKLALVSDYFAHYAGHLVHVAGFERLRCAACQEEVFPELVAQRELPGEERSDRLAIRRVSAALKRHFEAHARGAESRPRSREGWLAMAQELFPPGVVMAQE